MTAGVASSADTAVAQAAKALLMLVAAAFGIAISRLPAAARRLLVDFFKASAAAMLIIINWALNAAPIGIFVLILEASTDVGPGLTPNLVQYVLLILIALGIGLSCAALIGFSSGPSPMRYLQAAPGPQALAAPTQFSMACLPSLVQAARVARATVAIRGRRCVHAT